MEFGDAHGAEAWLLLIAAAAGALLTLGAFGRAAWRGLRRLVKLVDLIEVTERRSRELIRNGGGSIKDRSDQTAARLSKLESGLQRMEGQVGALARTVDRHITGGDP